ncbi:MAG TPA: hypothetical protein VFI24_27195 [Pyrinomonadaceae bacterium]|nr:hypothetical protein [Pyrinomonadaceae bacterium]
MVARKSVRKPKPRKAARKTKPAKKISKAKARKYPAKGPETSPDTNKAMRLTFSYDGDDVKLLSKQRTDMILPPSDVVKGYGKYKGFWAEVRNGSDKTLYRTVMHNPTKNDAEVFPESPDGDISREPAPKRKGVFVVLVPEIDNGEDVILCRSGSKTRGPASGIHSLAGEPAKEILRLKLKK